MPEFAETTASLEAYPNITAAAEMLGVAASTLSRRDDLVKQGRGERDQVLSATEVLRLGAIHRKRSLNDVAQALIDHAQEASPEEASRVEQEIEEFFDANSIEAQQDELLRLARRLLPPELRKRIETTLAEEAEELPPMIEGYPPVPPSEPSGG